MDFGSSVAANISAIKMEMDNEYRSRIQRLSDRIVDSTPVGKPELYSKPPAKGYKPGGLKANWVIGVNSLPTADLPKKDTTGASTKRAIATQLKNIRIIDTVFLANNRPYAYLIEYTNWSVQQAPAAMVRTNLDVFSR